MNSDTTYPVSLDTLNKWDELCEAGRIAREQIDHWKWYIGDVANRVVILYPPREIGENDHTLAEFARDTNIMKSSMYQYRRVADFYPFYTRVQFVDEHPNLTWTHFRIAMSVGDTESAYELLEECSAQGWTTDELAYHLSNRKIDGSNDVSIAAIPSYTAHGAFVSLQGNLISIRLKNGSQSDFRALIGKRIEIIIKKLSE